MKVTPMSVLSQMPPLVVHDKLSPEHEQRLRATWDVLKGFYLVSTWEKYEHMTCCNLHPEFDIEFLEFLAERFKAYRQNHPKPGTFHLKRYLTKTLPCEFFKTHPVATIFNRAEGVLSEVWADGSVLPVA